MSFYYPAKINLDLTRHAPIQNFDIAQLNLPPLKKHSAEDYNSWAKENSKFLTGELKSVERSYSPNKLTDTQKDYLKKILYLWSSYKDDPFRGVLDDRNRIDDVLSNYKRIFFYLGEASRANGKDIVTDRGFTLKKADIIKKLGLQEDYIRNKLLPRYFGNH